MRSRHLTNPDAPQGDCCLAWYAEYQRAALLLETLADDHFPDEAAFDAWLARQLSITLRRRPPEQPTEVSRG